MSHPVKSLAQRLLKRIAAGALSLFFAGCATLLPTPTPIPTHWHTSSPGSKTLVVMLPGRGDSLEDFERNGFIETLRAAGVHADVVTVGAHLGYYYRRTILDRLRVDVIEPARGKGYRRIVVVGISLGGLGGVLLARDHPDAVQALVLLSPYLGDRDSLFDQIDAAGGPALWSGERVLRSGDVQEEIWTFLGQRSEKLPPTWLYTGARDRLRRGHALLAGLLPTERVRIAENGRHDWKTWRALWAEACRDPRLWQDEAP